jgi:hypothetical protein
MNYEATLPKDCKTLFPIKIKRIKFDHWHAISAVRIFFSFFLHSMKKKERKKQLHKIEFMIHDA